MAKVLMDMLCVFLLSSSIPIYISSRPTRSEADDQALRHGETLDITIDSLQYLCDASDEHGVSAVDPVKNTVRNHTCEVAHCHLVRDCLQCLHGAVGAQSSCFNKEGGKSGCHGLIEALIEDITHTMTYKSRASVFLWTGDFANSESARGQNFITLESFQVSSCVMRTMEELSDPSTKFVPPELWKLFVHIWDFLSTAFVKDTMMSPLKMWSKGAPIAHVGIFLDHWKPKSTIDCQEIPSVGWELGKYAEQRQKQQEKEPAQLHVKLFNNGSSFTCSMLLSTSCNAARIRMCVFQMLTKGKNSKLSEYHPFVTDNHCCEEDSRFLDSHTCHRLATSYTSSAKCEVSGEGYQITDSSQSHSTKREQVTGYKRKST